MFEIFTNYRFKEMASLVQLQVIALLLCCSIPAVGQLGAGAKVKGFKVADQQNGKRKFYLVGKEAVSLAKGEWRITDFKIETYGDNGKTTLMVTAPECVYNASNRVARGEGPIQVLTGDGRLSLKGIGFVWTQPRNHLAISNNVQTVIFRSDATNTVSTNTILINSDAMTLDMESRRANFTGHVQAKAETTEISCLDLVGLLGEKPGEVEEIISTGDVRILSKEDKSVTTGNRAVYVTATDTVDLTGNVSWSQGDRAGTSDRVRLDRRNRGLAASGNVRVKMPRESLGTSTVLSISPGGPTNAASASAWVEVLSGQLTTATNRITFGSGVTVVDNSTKPAMRMLADDLIVHTSTKGAPQLVEAIGKASITQGTQKIQSAKLRFEPNSDHLQFDGAVSWSWDGQEGTTDQLIIGTKDHAVAATGHSVLYFPIHNLGDKTNMFLPFAQRDPKGMPKADDRLRVESASFQVTSNLAVFNGSVNIRNGTEASTADSLECNRLTIDLLPPGNRMTKLVAEDSVTIRSRGASNAAQAVIKGQKLVATGLDSPQGTNSQMKVELLGGVDISRGNLAAKAERADYHQTHEIIVLSGKPEAKNDEMTMLDASKIFWHWKENRFSAEGKWRAAWVRDLLKPNPQKPANPPATK